MRSGVSDNKYTLHDPDRDVLGVNGFRGSRRAGTGDMVNNRWIHYFSYTSSLLWHESEDNRTRPAGSNAGLEFVSGATRIALGLN
jgi:hypothetical protein